jgi:hypothetical protein
VGRHGTVWVAWLDPTDDARRGEDDLGTAGWEASWQPDGVGTRPLEDAWFETLDEALAWAGSRTDSVVVRPWWDQSRYYWAGVGQDTRGLPRLGPPPSA